MKKEEESRLEKKMDKYFGLMMDEVQKMATKEDIANMATKEDIANMATKEDVHGIVNTALNGFKAEIRQEMQEGFAAQGEEMQGGFAAQSERLSNLEKGQHEILDILHPLSRAHSIDAVTIVRHERRITRIEKHLDLAMK